MRVKLGLIAPFAIQIGILYLYSSIRYQVIDRAIVTLILLLLFPIIILYVLFPSTIIFIGQLERRISNKLLSEMDAILFSENDVDNLELEKTIVEKEFFFNDNPTISSRIKDRLIPMLTKRAINTYQTTFFSREYKIQAEKSLNYFESLFHFSILNGGFFIIDAILLISMYFRSLNLFFITLDRILEFSIFLILFVITISIILLSIYIYKFAIGKIEIFLPYVVPILFTENKDEKYLRRQTIRSIFGYNLENLLERRDQLKYSPLISGTIESLVEPLLKEELLITASKEFARKIAWREYSALIQSDLIEKNYWQSTPIERLFIGLNVGEMKIEEKDLFGLNTDIEYILDVLNNWKQKSKDTKLIAYFRLYRIVEYIMKEIGKIYKMQSDQDDTLYTVLKNLLDLEKIDKNQFSLFQGIRLRRNKLMHQPGISLQISREIFIESIDTLNFILEDLEN